MDPLLCSHPAIPRDRPLNTGRLYMKTTITARQLFHRTVG